MFVEVSEFDRTPISFENQIAAGKYGTPTSRGSTG